MVIKILKTRKYKLGYHIRYEEISDSGSPPIIMRSAYTPDGQYIGDSKTARFLLKKGIRPEKANKKINICTVGFCEKDKKWYGWSHRAIVGFEIGNKLFDEKFPDATDKTPFIEHGGKTIKTFTEARQAAVNFAEYVS